MSADIHTCSYQCQRPACVLAQRDELAKRAEQDAAEIVRLRGEVKKLADDVQVPPDPTAHRWNDDGERCLICGDKDWMGGPCSGGAVSATVNGVNGLVVKWRESAASAKRYSVTEYEDGCASAEKRCADELESAIRSSEHLATAGVRTASIAPAEEKGDALDLGEPDELTPAMLRMVTPQPADGEAVATVVHGEGGPGGVRLKLRKGFSWHSLPHGTSLYTTPPAAQVQQEAVDVEAALDAGDPNWRKLQRPNLKGAEQLWYAVRDIAEYRRWLAGEAPPLPGSGLAVVRTGPGYRHLPCFDEVAGEGDEPMSMEVALDFADNPRPRHTLAAPADTNGELYRALRVIAAAYRAARPSACELGADDVAEIISRDKRVWALAALAEKCGAVKDEGESGLFWTLTLGDFYKLEAALQHRGDSRGGEVGCG